MGSMMRAYWHPVCTSAQLRKPDPPPLRVRLLGEHYVAFRDSAGNVGLLETLHGTGRLARPRARRKRADPMPYHGWNST